MSKAKKFTIAGLVVALTAGIIIKLGFGGGETLIASGDLKIIKSEVTETARFYPYKAGKVKMEVLAVKASDGTIRTAFNTCQVCYGSGRGYYKQQGNELVCQNCGNRFSFDQVEKIQGGCNPVPILGKYKTEDEESIIISKDFLEKYKDLFVNWKK